MIQVLVHHEVNDYRSWRAVLEAAIDFRQLGGETGWRDWNSRDCVLIGEVHGAPRRR